MADMFNQSSRSPAGEKLIQELMRDSFFAPTSIGIDTNKVRKETLSLLQLIHNACLKHALYAPKMDLFREFVLSPNRDSVIEANFFEDKFEINPASVYEAASLPAGIIFEEKKKVSYRELSISWDPLDKSCTIETQMFLSLSNTIRKDTYIVDLTNGCVRSHSRGLSDISGYRGDGKGKIFALESPLALEEMKPSNRTINKLLRKLTNDDASLTKMGDYYAEHYKLKVSLIDKLEAVFLNQNESNATLEEYKQLYTQTFSNCPEYKTIDQFYWLNSCLQKATALNFENVSEIMQRYAEVYRELHQQPRGILNVVADESISTSDPILYEKLCHFFGGKFKDFVLFMESPENTDDLYRLNILKQEFKRKVELGQNLEARIDPETNKYIFTNSSQEALLELQKRTGESVLTFDVAALNAADIRVIVNAPLKYSDITPATIRNTRLKDIIAQKLAEETSCIQDILGDVVLNGCTDSLTHQLVHDDIKWLGMKNTIASIFRRGLQLVLELHEHGRNKLKLHFRKPEDSDVLLQQLQANKFDVIAFDAKKSNSIVLYRIEDGCAKLIAAPIWFEYETAELIATISELKKRHAVSSIEFPTDPRSALFDVHKQAYNNAARLKLNFVHAGRAEFLQ